MFDIQIYVMSWGLVDLVVEQESWGGMASPDFTPGVSAIWEKNKFSGLWQCLDLKDGGNDLRS